ncbi:Non-heme 11 kDa protein of cytochrome bc1 complex [Hypoxylon sp. NC1633]|nr:Non-heme 11 kDa protein of cytochrome bc1 complex [Hypoxylon sp. NC1633]
MGIWDTISDLVEAATPWSTAEAEAPAEDKEPQEEESEKSKDGSKEEGGDDAEEEEEEEEEEDEEEIEDPKEKLEEECKNSKQCAPAKHHFDECVERVTNASDDSEAPEDCVEEFFHLAHCASQCAAPKLWSILK